MTREERRSAVRMATSRERAELRDRWQRLWAAAVIGTRVRKAHPPGRPGLLAHVVAKFETHDDGRKLVIRWWVASKQRWFYEVLERPAIDVGLWDLEGGRNG